MYFRECISIVDISGLDSYRKVIEMGIIKKLFGNKKNTESELKAAVLKKATDHMNANSESADSDENVEGSVAEKKYPAYENVDKVKKKYIRAVLLAIAENGEMGALPISISDNTGINQRDTSTALAFLTKENYVDAVNSATGFKYYLTKAGKKYCLSKEFNSL